MMNFGSNPLLYQRAPMGLGMPQPADSAPQAWPETPQVQAPKPGMFGGSNIAQILAAALSGYTASSNPAPQQAIFQAMALKRRQAEEEAQYQRERQDKRSDFTFEQDYKAAHDTPDISQRIAVLNAIHPGLGDTYAQNYARNGGGLGLVTNAQTGQQYAQPSSLTPPAEAIARLRANPAEAQQFDEIFGPGTSTGILGGPAPQAPGGFSGY